MLDDKGMHEPQGIPRYLVYSAQCFRYDIIFSVVQLARAISNPSKVHGTTAKTKHLLRYLKGQPIIVIKFQSGDSNLQGFSDTSWGGSPEI